MTTRRRVEVTIPIAEEVLLDFLLSRYSTDQLKRLGIQTENSVIRDMQIVPQGDDSRCTFRVCVLTPIDVEDVLETDAHNARKISEEIAAEEMERLRSENQDVKPVIEGCGGCGNHGGHALRIEKQKNSSNKTG